MDVAKCTSLPITIVFLPASDIATYVGEGNVDIGITGLDVVKESQETDVEQILVVNYVDKNILYTKNLTYFMKGIGIWKMQIMSSSTSHQWD